MSVPTYTQPEQQQSRRSRRTLWIIIGSILAIALIGSAIYVGVIAFTAISSLKQNGSIPERYYLNILSGDYTTAYSYLDKNATIEGQQMNQQSFIRPAKAADAQYGTVHGVSLNTESEATHVTATISRVSHSYDVHLVLKQENGTWKIVSADGI
jgi:F0F1-type ATP synthase membrane subunit c/vacuolar-type H+-ATPase subunit K